MNRFQKPFLAPRHALTLAAAWVCASSPLRAQEVQVATAPAQEVEVTARHYDNAVGSSDAASQGVVRAEMIGSRPLLRPGEVLETVPGLVVTQHSGDGKANQYFLRGFNLDHGTDFATTVDGLPVNMPTHAHGQGYSDLNFLIPELVDRIEYRKGPYFAKNGDFSAAGSADIHYRQTLDAPFAQLTLGGEGYRRLAGADSTALGPGLSLLGAVELMGDNEPWTLKEGLQRRNGLAILSGGTAASGWSAGFVGYDAHWRSTDQVPQRLIDAGTYQGKPFGRFDAVDPSDGGETSRSSVSAAWHDTDAQGTTQVSAYAMHYTLKLFSNFTYFMDRPATGDQFSQHDARNVFGAVASRAFDHHWGPFEARSELGLQLRHDRIHVGLFDTQDRNTIGVTRADNVRETLASVYAQTAVDWASKLRSLIGVRGDRVQADVSSLLQPLNSGSASQSLLSPKFSLVFGPWS